MRAEELRIGNLIEHNYFSSPPVTITGLKKDKGTDLVYISDPTFNTINIEQVKPIPLTEEWLVKFGFKFTDEFDFNLKGLSLDGGVCHFSFDMFRGLYNIENCDFVELPTFVKHVHQLQNLYFALTGEELTIKK